MSAETKVNNCFIINKMYVMQFLSFYTIKPLTLQMDHAKLIDILTSLTVSHAILPRAMCFATSRPAKHQYVAILTRVDMHLGQSEDVYS